MKTRVLNDPINRVILHNWDTEYSEIAKIIKDKFDQNITNEQIRARKRGMRSKFGDNLENIHKFSEELEANGFEPHNWKHGWLKTEDVSLFIKNNEENVSYEEVRDEFIETLQKYSPKYKTFTYEKTKEPHMLVIDPADVHIGKLAMNQESGNDYDIEIAKKRCFDGVKGIVEKASGYDIEKILLVIGNDILHIDTPYRQTTKGTPQDTDKQWWYAYVQARSMYVEIIEGLMQIAPVHIVYCPSNHDYVSGFMLADSIACWFSKAKNVTFDVTMRHRKYMRYDMNMLEFDHGDGHKETDTPLIMASEQPQMWANTKFRYSYKHHKHHMRELKWQSGKDYHGVTMQYLRSPAGHDRWHTTNGYDYVPLAIEGFIINPKHGQVARLSHYF